MTARFAAHNPPDVFYVDSSVVGGWAKQGVLQPLNSYIKTQFNTKAFYPKLLNAFKEGQEIYGFPKDWSPLAEEINNAISGRPVSKAPKTWAQLKSDAQDDSVRRASPRHADLPLARLGADGRLHVPEQGLAREALHVDAATPVRSSSTSA